MTHEFTRREMLKGGTVAGAALASGALLSAQPAEAAQPKHGGTFRVNGYDPRGFDPRLALTYRTQTSQSATLRLSQTWSKPGRNLTM